jgi:MFS superfamily sulfate permease-like transporter
VSAARTLARENNYEIDSRRELLAIGASNIVVALGTGYPVSGGLSQSVINAKAGAKTPVSLVIASITLTVCLLFLTGLLKNLPSVMLSCIVLVAISSLVDIKEFIRLGRVNRFDFLVAMIALICVISFGILQGVVLSALASLIILIRIASTPHVAFLGKIPGFERYSDISRHPENQVIPNMLLFRVEAPLLYFNISYIYEVIWKKVISMKDSLKLVIFDLSTSAYVDSSGARMIRKLHDELQKLGIEFNIVEAHSEVRDILRIEDLENVFGHISRKVSVEEVVDSAREKLENQYKRKKKKK